MSLFNLCTCFGGPCLCPKQLTQGLEYSRCLLNIVRMNHIHEYFIEHICLKFLKSLGFLVPGCGLKCGGGGE